MTMLEDVKAIVKDGYGRLVSAHCTACSTTSFACGLPEQHTHDVARRMGYTAEELRTVPEQANLGLGCGNPVALAALQAGERVLDLGAGAGLDALLAAQKVGPEGTVIGIDITPEMVALARDNASRCACGNVEFREGDMEDVPLGDASVNVVMANCSVNLAPDKGKTFREAYRVLKEGGRIAVADLVLLAPLPDILSGSVEAYIGCLASAEMREEYLAAMARAGFADVAIVRQEPHPLAAFAYEPLGRVVRACLSPEEAEQLDRSVAAVAIIGRKR
jgi:arsenite methyltransferase